MPGVIRTQSFARKLLVIVGMSVIVSVIATSGIVSIGSTDQQSVVLCVGQNSDVVLTIVLEKGRKKMDQAFNYKTPTLFFKWKFNYLRFAFEQT